MNKYIGTKLIEAEPCPAWKDFGKHKTGDPGYKVLYPDGYEIWSPKDVFEKAYLPLTINENLRTNAPSISPPLSRWQAVQVRASTPSGWVKKAIAATVPR